MLPETLADIPCRFCSRKALIAQFRAQERYAGDCDFRTKSGINLTLTHREEPEITRILCALCEESMEIHDPETQLDPGWLKQHFGEH